jgi:hypothetical protein
MNGRGAYAFLRGLRGYQHHGHLTASTKQASIPYWKALAFQRRSKIILGVGSVSGKGVGIPDNSGSQIVTLLLKYLRGG